MSKMATSEFSTSIVSKLLFNSTSAGSKDFGLTNKSEWLDAIFDLYKLSPPFMELIVETASPLISKSITFDTGLEFKVYRDKRNQISTKICGWP